jgi:hypothetical protein
MGLCLRRGGHVGVEVGGNGGFAVNHFAVSCDEDGDAVAVGSFAEQESLLALDGDLAGDVVDPEFG